MKRKRICAWFITVAMLLTMLPSAFAVSFADNRGHWAEDEINRWSDRGVIQGRDGDFEPNSPITRADMAVIIDRVMDYQTKAENNFADLGTAYYTDPILRVAQAGVMQGDGKNVRPKDKVTREEAVSMLARALSVTAGGSSTNFADNSRISSWAMANVAAFAENGYIAGRSGNRFEPKANITRAEVVKLLDNMISDYITESGTATPKGTDIVIVKASGVTLNKAKLSSTVVLGGKAGEVKATDCEITGKVVKIHNSTLVTSGSTSTGSRTLCADAERRKDEIHDRNDCRTGDRPDLAVLPWGHIHDLGIRHLPRKLTRADLDADRIDDALEDEQCEYNVQIVEPAEERDDLGQTVQHDVDRNNNLWGDGRRLFAQQTEQDSGQQRHGEEAPTLIDEVHNAGAEEHNERCNGDGNHADSRAEDLADLNNLAVGGLLAPDGLPNVQGEDGGCGIQHRIERGQDRAEHNGCKEAHQRFGQHFHNEKRVRLVSRHADRGVHLAVCSQQLERDDARQNDDKYVKALEEAGPDRALLALCEVFAAQRTLDDGLVGRPVEQVVDEHTGQQQRPRYFRRERVRRGPCVHLFRRCGDEVIQTGHEAAAVQLAEGDNAEDRDSEAADDQTDAIDGIRVGNGF